MSDHIGGSLKAEEVKTSYTIEVQTGNLGYAGTGANVYIQLFGGKGISDEILLPATHKNKFERGTKYTHTINDVTVFGWLNKLRIFHDSTGDNPGWYLNYIRVTDVANKISWRVDLNRWLSSNNGDKLTDITVPIPVDSEVVLESDTLKLNTIPIGYVSFQYSNEGTGEVDDERTFKYSYTEGTTIDLSSTKSIDASAGFKLGSDFFGAESTFSTKISAEVAKKLGTSEVETLEMDVKYGPYNVPKGAKLTTAFLFSQNVLVSNATSNGVNFNYAKKFLISYSTFVFEGLLSADEVRDRLKDMLKNKSNVLDQKLFQQFDWLQLP